MSQRRYYNPYLPQTLVIAQILLYLNAVFEGLSLIQVGLSSFQYPIVGKVLLFISVASGVFGAYGIANESKIGYQVAVLASFMPLITRIVSVLLVGASIARNLNFILLGGNVLNVLFEYALIALLLHPQSSHHQKIWFK